MRRWGEERMRRCGEGKKERMRRWGEGKNEKVGRRKE